MASFLSPFREQANKLKKTGKRSYKYRLISLRKLCSYKYSKNPCVRTYFLRVWQNVVLYFGVLTGMLVLVHIDYYMLRA